MKTRQEFDWLVHKPSGERIPAIAWASPFRRIYEDNNHAFSARNILGLTVLALGKQNRANRAIKTFPDDISRTDVVDALQSIASGTKHPPLTHQELFNASFEGLKRNPGLIAVRAVIIAHRKYENEVSFYGEDAPRTIATDLASYTELLHQEAVDISVELQPAA